MKIADFNSLVEGIMKSVDPAKPTPKVLGEATSTNDPLEAYVLDTDKVSVPDAFVETLLGKRTLVESKEEEVEELDEQAKVTQLVSELTTVVSRAKKLIQELTTCGMIGVNTASKSKQPKKKVKYGYSQSNKRS